jgi:hypothetical protein
MVNQIPGDSPLPFDGSGASPQIELAPPPPKPENVDEEVYEAWKAHMIEGYQHNSQMFDNLLDAFMRPYWQTVWMYRLMFFVGIVGFVLAAILGVTLGIEFGALFGGLTVVSFLAFFINRPLQSLEQNILLITWLGVIYNTYWTRLMYANDNATIQADLQEITQKTIEDLGKLTEVHTELSGKRPSIGGQE